MKMTTEILKSTGIMFIVLLIVASYLETGDATAISMYFVVFAIPLILVSILNGGWLNQIEKLKKKAKIKRGLSSIPVVILIIGFLQKSDVYFSVSYICIEKQNYKKESN